MSRNLDDLNNQVNALQSVCAILIIQIRRLGGNSQALNYAMELMSAQDVSPVVASEQSNQTDKGV
jgi:hypothetical protein